MSRIKVETSIPASLSEVWDAYTKPEHIVNWNFAIDTWHCPYAENDLRVGGKFISRMAEKEGPISFDFGGIYTDVKPLEIIKYEMEDGRKVEVYFIHQGSETQVIIDFDAETQNSEELQQQGWQAILNNFSRYVVSLK